MRLAPHLAVALLPALLLVATGCHKRTRYAHRQPPPPDIYRRSNDRAATRSASRDRSAPEPGAARSLPVPSSVDGKPFSTQVGLASWYGPPYAGRKGADGKVYDQNAMTAAHLTLPLGTLVRVTNLTNNESAVVRITDRGPFVHGRIIDLSLAAAKATGVYRAGVAKVRVEAFASAPKPSTAAGGHWCVQVGAFDKQKDAIHLKEHLLRRYTTAKVIEFAGPTGYWVRINPRVPDKQQADEIADGIHVKDAEPYVIRTD